MIDHILGRPSIAFRKYQVGIAVAFWSTYLVKGNSHGPPGARRLSALLSKRLTAWQTAVITMLALYLLRNFGKIVGLESPEPLANLYTRGYFRATYVMTALDAGFWSAMRIRRKWARDLMSMVCTIYYLICAEQADEKVRKVRAVLTVDHLRVSWNKSLTPYLFFLTRLTRPRFTSHRPRAIRIPRPPTSAYKEPVLAWLYFDGPVSSLRRQTKVVLNIPGGGFVAMSPRTHDDSLLAWAGKTGLPVLSLDYGKAPEYPYPYALNECFDVYTTLVASRGRCINFSGDTVPQIVVAGDSAGGNLAAGLTLMILQSGATETRRWLGQESLPVPAGLVLVYPALDVNIGNWMTDEQMALIRDRQTRRTNRAVMRHKSNDFKKLSPSTPVAPDDDDDDDDDEGEAVLAKSRSRRSPRANRKAMRGDATGEATSEKSTASQQAVAPAVESGLAETVRTRLATPSLMSYVSDRILTPEMMRAMIILYIGPHNRPDFSTDFLLSPVLAPDELLQNFPKTYFLTGERDPLVDDTLIMAGRIRAAKKQAWQSAREMGVLTSREERRGFDEREHVEVNLIKGISHGFIQFASVWPQAWTYIHAIGKCFEECFANADRAAARRHRHHHFQAIKSRASERGPSHRHTYSSGDEDRPLEMSLKLTRSNTNRAAESGSNAAGGDAADGATHHHGDDGGATTPGTGTVTAATSGFFFDETVPPTPYTPGVPDGAGGGYGFAKDHPLGRRRPSAGTRNLTSRASSSDDLLGRRMAGLAGGLTKANPDL